MTDAFTCPICRNEQATVKPTPNGRDALDITCKCCGSFEIAGTAEPAVRERRPEPRLIAWIRQQHDAGEKPKIDSTTLERVIAAAPDYSVAEKQQLLLQWLAKMIKVPGDVARVRDQSDWPVIWARDPAEFSFHLLAARERGLIKQGDAGGYFAIELTAAGWECLDRATGELVFDDRAFVAMWFDDSMNTAWNEGLKHGIEAAGYRALRVDSALHIDRIDLKIIGDIRASRFVVADVTGQRPGVYFEAGYALALGRPVVWTVHKDQCDKIHFDTRQFSHIFWTTPQDLATQLEAVIAGTIGRRKNRQ